MTRSILCPKIRSITFGDACIYLVERHASRHFPEVFCSTSCCINLCILKLQNDLLSPTASFVSSFTVIIMCLYFGRLIPAPKNALYSASSKVLAIPKAFSCGLHFRSKADICTTDFLEENTGILIAICSALAEVPVCIQVPIVTNNHLCCKLNNWNTGNFTNMVLCLKNVGLPRLHIPVLHIQ